MAKPAVYAFCHVDVIPRGTSAPVFTFLGLDRDGRGWADGFAKLACNTALFARGVTAQGVFATEAGRDGTFLERVIDCVAKNKGVRTLKCV